MSTLSTNAIIPVTGTTVTLGESGDTITIPSGATITNSGTATGFGGGKLLNFVHTVKTDTFSLATTYTWTDVTGLSVTITPSATSSKILVNASLNVGASVNYAQARIVDGSGNFITGFGGDTAGSRNRGCWGVFYRNTDGGPNIMHSMSAHLYHTSNSTSAQTYKVQLFTYSATQYVNRSVTDTDNANNSRTCSTISAMEIGA